MRNPDRVPLDRNGLEVLTREDCDHLLTQQSFGRVGLSIAALPVVLPVNYGVLDGDVVFRTVEGTKLAGAAAGAVVAFEVDDIDREGHGWSVLVVGRAAVIVDGVDRARADAVIPATWLPTEPSHIVRVRSELVSGRRLVPADAAVSAASASA
jgi:nitroimidazol reductase NimA-like FMN-containing flavoprotein (pyridoxamine 5'-phosphate oxidase superfamily)